MLPDRPDGAVVARRLDQIRSDPPVQELVDGSYTTSGAANFHEWHHDVPGVDESTSIALSLTTTGAANDFYVYENLSFFPLDNQLFGNEGRPHNYHFTLEAHTHFRYVGGETFAFSGDDDTWVFINVDRRRQLVRMTAVRE